MGVIRTSARERGFHNFVQPKHPYDVNKKNMRYWVPIGENEDAGEYNKKINQYTKALLHKFPQYNHPWSDRKDHVYSTAHPRDFNERNLSALFQDFKQRVKLTVPFNPNTGPGNDVEPPGSTSDVHSITHDKAYEDAKSAMDVVAADETFINEQLDHVIEDPIGSVSNINAMIGSAGIAAKKFVEGHIGVQYPGEFNYILTLYVRRF